MVYYFDILFLECVSNFQGKEALQLLTTRTKQELRVNLQKFSGEKAYRKYFIFTIGCRSNKYKLTVEGYRGTAGKQE